MIIVTIVTGETVKHWFAFVDVSNIDVVPHSFGSRMKAVAIIVDQRMSVVDFEEFFAVEINNILSRNAVKKVRVIEMLHDRHAGFFSLPDDSIQVSLHNLLQ